MGRDAFTETVIALMNRRPFRPYTVVTVAGAATRSITRPRWPRAKGWRSLPGRATFRCSSTTRALAKSSETLPAVGRKPLEWRPTRAMHPFGDAMTPPHS